MLLAGLQSLPDDVFEAARVDGANRWRLFWDMTFPLLLPVSLTAVVIRMIFEFKVIDIIMVVTDGGPGNATETLTSYIYRRGLNPGLDVGYATAMAVLFLIVITVTVTLVLGLGNRRIRKLIE
jgi:multiple sugar transport system permease protein